MGAIPASDDAAACPCGRCGYDLRGLNEAGRCPECAALVATTLRARRELGLESSEPSPRMIRLAWISFWALFAVGVSRLVLRNASGRENRVGLPADLLVLSLELLLCSMLLPLLSIGLFLRRCRAIGHTSSQIGALRLVQRVALGLWLVSVATAVGYGTIAGTNARRQLGSLDDLEFLVQAGHLPASYAEYMLRARWLTHALSYWLAIWCVLLMHTIVSAGRAKVAPRFQSAWIATFELVCLAAGMGLCVAGVFLTPLASWFVAGRPNGLWELSSAAETLALLGALVAMLTLAERLGARGEPNPPSPEARAEVRSALHAHLAPMLVLVGLLAAVATALVLFARDRRILGVIWHRSDGVSLLSIASVLLACELSAVSRACAGRVTLRGVVWRRGARIALAAPIGIVCILGVSDSLGAISPPDGVEYLLYGALALCQVWAIRGLMHAVEMACDAQLPHWAWIGNRASAGLVGAFAVGAFAYCSVAPGTIVMSNRWLSAAEIVPLDWIAAGLTVWVVVVSLASLLLARRMLGAAGGVSAALAGRGPG
ncbi:MAG: hypothetical protein U1A27_13215 [Phycisphaerae bacterium]